MRLSWNDRVATVLASSVALFACATVDAAPKNPCEAKAQQAEATQCDEPKPGPFAFVYPVDLNLACPRDFYFHIDGLAMQAKEDGLEFAISDGNSTTASITSGTVYGFSGSSSDYDYNPGIRFGLGFYLDHDAWNLDFNWTWLNITNYKTVGTSSGEVLIPLWIIPNSSIPSAIANQGANAKWDVSYNTLDVRLAKPYHVSRYLVFAPHFGIRAGWIDQTFAADYGNMVSGVTTINPSAQNNFWGVGARCGLDTEWSLGKGWCLFGNVATSMLFGKFDVDQSLSFTISGTTDGYDLENDFYQNVSNYEIAMGLGWDKFFSKNKYHVSLRGGYEFHEWFDQNNMRKFFGSNTTTYVNDTVSRGNLTLNGFSLRVQLDI